MTKLAHGLFIAASLVISIGCSSNKGAHSQTVFNQATEETQSGLSDALLTPLTSLNLRREEIPALLLTFQTAYDPILSQDCESLSNAVIALDSVLGPDINDVQPPTESTGQQAGSAAAKATLNAVSKTTGSIIPMSGIVSRITGATQHQQRLFAAYRLGSERRAFLKGRGLQLGCSWPAAPLQADAK